MKHEFVGCINSHNYIYYYLLVNIFEGERILWSMHLEGGEFCEHDSELDGSVATDELDFVVLGK